MSATRFKWQVQEYVLFLSSFQKCQKNHINLMDIFSSPDIWQEPTSGISCYLLKNKTMKLLFQLVYSADFLWKKKARLSDQPPDDYVPNLFFPQQMNV